MGTRTSSLGEAIGVSAAALVAWVLVAFSSRPWHRVPVPPAGGAAGRPPAARSRPAPCRRRGWGEVLDLLDRLDGAEVEARWPRGSAARFRAWWRVWEDPYA